MSLKFISQQVSHSGTLLVQLLSEEAEFKEMPLSSHLGCSSERKRFLEEFLHQLICADFEDNGIGERLCQTI